MNRVGYIKYDQIKVTPTHVEFSHKGILMHTMALGTVICKGDTLTLKGIKGKVEVSLGGI